MKIRTLSLILASLSYAGLTAWATPLSSEVTAVSTLTPGATVTNTDSWAGTPADLYAASNNALGNGIVISQAMTFSSAADGNSGTTFFYTQWVLNQGSTYAAAEGTSWAYSFVADATGSFVMNYGGSLSGTNTFGLNGYQLTGDLGSHYFDAGTADQFVASVIQGFTYSIHLGVSANIGGELSDQQGIMSGNFRWTLPGSTSVPDAANAGGLMLLSVTGLLALRRKLARS